MSDNARDQAILQVESIVYMVAALEVDYDRLEELRGERADSAFPSRILAQNPDHTGGWWEDENPGDAEELAEMEEAAGDCSDEEEAREMIQDDPLSIEVRSAWCSLGDDMQPSEARIVLCTGGPHVEILCDLENGNPSRPRVVYKDWGTSGELFDFDHDAVTRYLEQFYFGE